MRLIGRHRQELGPLLESAVRAGDADALYEHIACHSALPGPRANLELAEAFRQEIGAGALGDAEHVWPMCLAMTHVPEAEAPTGDPREMIPFCGCWAGPGGDRGATRPLGAGGL